LPNPQIKRKDTRTKRNRKKPDKETSKKREENKSIERAAKQAKRSDETLRKW
jgi:hypothetical protein